MTLGCHARRKIGQNKKTTLLPPSPGLSTTLKIEPPLICDYMSPRPLQQMGESADDSKTEEGGANVNAGGTVVLVAAAAAAAAGGVGAGILVGVGVVAGAREGALDLATATLAAEATEGLAGGSDVTGRRDVEGTLDVVKGRELDTGPRVSQMPLRGQKDTLCCKEGVGVWVEVGTYSVKFPRSLTAPPTLLTLGNPVISSSPVLLAIRRPPPMAVRTGKVMLVSWELPTNEISPVFVDVRLGALNEVK